MIQSLSIKNYALIEQLDIDFHRGFSVITGETGAGKSILIGAIGLLLGQRAETRMIKAGESRCVIEAVFDLTDYGMDDFFVRHDLVSNIIAVALLVVANWFDCADGQLARMTGKKTLVGRILDGFAGDVWFQFIYVALAIRLTPTWGIWGWLLGAYAGYWCHIRQANLADYYRNLHLFFQLGPARSELDRSHLLRQRYDSLRWHSSAWFEKLYLFFYIRYTLRQEHMTPRCQEMLNHLLSPTSAGSVGNLSPTPAGSVGGVLPPLLPLPPPLPRSAKPSSVAAVP